MTQDIELLNQIHQNADMGRDSVRHVIQLSNDVQFLHALNSQLDEYELATRKAAECSEPMGLPRRMQALSPRQWPGCPPP